MFALSNPAKVRDEKNILNSLTNPKNYCALNNNQKKLNRIKKCNGIMIHSVFVRLCLSIGFLTVLCPIVTLSRVAAFADMDVNVLEDHRVVYSSPKVQTKYQSVSK